MGKKIRNIACIIIFSAFILTLGAACILREPVEILVSERRKAQQLPEASVESVMDKSFFDGFEKYLTDQFPMRDGFRTINAAIRMKLLRQTDNSKVYLADGHISEFQSVLSENSVKNAAAKFNSIFEKYIKGKNARVYYSVVPDKNYYLAEKNGFPSLDYGRMLELYHSEIKNMEYIDIFDCLGADDYYTTDSHWKQENLGKVIDRLSKKMGFKSKPFSDYTAQKISDFEGVYAPRLALGKMSDEIIALSSPVTDGAKVFNLETNKTMQGVYDMSKLSGYDKYEIYLSGAAAFLTIENPLAEEKRELIVFRDSFGSSLVPLMLEGYSKITVVDIRYISPQILGEYVDFTDCDVLFIYNTLILNQSNILK
ncbi:MAG: hypothetical protein IJD78_09120 [Clostridia bacterium]|nr:hypothetical protein [Clostridia bacterium]